MLTKEEKSNKQKSLLLDTYQPVLITVAVKDILAALMFDKIYRVRINEGLVSCTSHKHALRLSSSPGIPPPVTLCSHSFHQLTNALKRFRNSKKEKTPGK